VCPKISNGDAEALENRMPRNGEINIKFGVYKTVCCGNEIVINAGSTFPDCPKHPRLTIEWKPVFDSKAEKSSARNSPKKSNDPAA